MSQWMDWLNEGINEWTDAGMKEGLVELTN